MSVRYAAIFLVAVASLLAASPVRAEHDLDWQGWILELEGLYLQPGGDDTDLFARTIAPRTIGFPFPGQNDITQLDWDQNFSFAAAAGYSFGRAGAVRVSFWTYSDKTEIQGASDSYYYGFIDAYNWWTIGPIDTISTVFDNAQFFEFETDMKFRTLDLEYLRTTGMGKPLTVTFGFGLRLAQFDETIEGTYTVDTNNDPNLVNLFRFPAKRDVGNEAWGVTASIGATYDFNSVVGINTNLRFGFLVVDLENSHQIQDQDDVLSLGVGGIFNEEVIKDNTSGTSLDFDLGVRTHIGGSFDLEIAWTYTSFKGLPGVDLNRASNTFVTPPLGRSPQSITRDEITFTGPSLKLLFFF